MVGAYHKRKLVYMAPYVPDDFFIGFYSVGLRVANLELGNTLGALGAVKVQIEVALW